MNIEYAQILRCQMGVVHDAPHSPPPPPPGNQKYSLGHSPCKKQIESAHVDTSHSYIVNASPHDVFFSKESKTLGKVVGFVTE